MKMRPGFTLAEVLIALALLGVVAAFTIPKVLQITAEQDKTARAKEAMASVYEVYHRAWLRNDLVDNQTTLSSLLTNNLNAMVDTTSKVDVAVGIAVGTHPVGDCAAHVNRICYRLPSGTLLTSTADILYRTGTDASSNKYALWITIDPDGKVDGRTTSRVGDAFSILLVNDGKLVSAGKMTESYTFDFVGGPGSSTLAPGTYADPAWLTW